jgi:hypothetical protein
MIITTITELMLQTFSWFSKSTATDQVLLIHYPPTKFLTVGMYWGLLLTDSEYAEWGRDRVVSGFGQSPCEHF